MSGRERDRAGDGRSRFHEGEQAVQTRAGVRELAERISPMIRSAMPEQHREFFAALPYFVLGAIDPQGRPFATILTGVPGFVSSPTPTTLAIDAWPEDGDPILPALTVDASVGLLGIQLHTRRRNRANGTLRALRTADTRGLVVEVDQSFGNCPQYIQARAIVGTRKTDRRVTPEGALLSAAARRIARRADTSFVASGARTIARDGVHGCDVSHRGGKRGFVRVDDVDGHSVLTMPDFAGNNFFMTLGNVAVRPEMGIALVDFDSGDVLSVTGRAETIWDGPELASFAKAERLVRIVVDEGVILHGALPFLWSEAELARQLFASGDW